MDAREKMFVAAPAVGGVRLIALSISICCHLHIGSVSIRTARCRAWLVIFAVRERPCAHDVGDRDHGSVVVGATAFARPFSSTGREHCQAG